MRTPTEVELQHFSAGYDPVKAREYYLRTRKLKGRKKGSSTAPSGRDPRTGLSKEQIQKNARAKQRKELSERIARLDGKLKQLEAKIREMEHKEASEDRKGKAKKERAAKERDKPKSAAEKAKDARESEKYRDKHKQELKAKAKKASNQSGGGSDKKKASSKKSTTLGDLKTLATKVKGQIAVAKQKLATL